MSSISSVNPPNIPSPASKPRPPEKTHDGDSQQGSRSSTTASHKSAATSTVNLLA